MTVHDRVAQAGKLYNPAARLFLITGGLIVVLGAITALMLVTSYNDVLRAQKAALRNIAIAFSAQTMSVAKAVDNTTIRAASILRYRHAAEVDDILRDGNSGGALDYIRRLTLVGADGQVLASISPPGPAENAALPPLPAFGRQASQSGGTRIVISDVDPKTGHGLINFIRAFAGRDGAPGGLVIAQVDSQRFEQLYSLVALGDGGSVTLFHQDGTMLVRGPAHPAGIGRMFSDTPLFRTYMPLAGRGMFSTSSPLDGTSRLYGYDSADGYPFVIVAGMDRRDALAPWYGRLWTALAFYALLSATLSFLAWRVARDAWRQAQLIGQLSASEARLRSDIAERERVEARLSYLAEFDVASGLPNQAQFWRRLETQIASAAVDGRAFAVLALEFERLHEIADLLGHDASERALQQIGARLRVAAGDLAVAARIRGAEFALMADAGEGPAAIQRFAFELHELCASPLLFDGREFFLGPVLGVAVFPQDAGSAEMLYRCAQGARAGAGTGLGEAIHFYSGRIDADLDRRLTLEAHLRRALAHGELRLVFQPKAMVRGGRVVGFEALLRWSNPVLGEVSPAQFIPIAERTGLILPIGAWVLEHACRRIGQWSRQFGRPVKVAVNLSPRQFYQNSLLATIRRCLEQHGVPPGCLEIEITETALMSREEEVARLMHDIRALGVELSIDDFGTGYSSLAYLKRFPVTRLKVDRAFVRDLGRDEDSAAIARSIVYLARELKLKVLAEGVETAAQLAVLREMDCEEYQGFLFSRPLEEAAVPALLHADHSHEAVHLLK
jgi:diguanylate cyclase (GGDEF)-like protein